MSDLSIEVIIPVQNMATELQKCVAPLVSQLGDGDVVTVVDDASSDRTADAAGELGVNVRRVSKSLGPYRARQLAANDSHADVLLFIDGRCRPLAGLLDGHRSLQSQPGVTLSCTDTRTLGGKQLAARVSARRQLFSLDHYVGVPGRTDYYPTCNLGVRRSAFDAVGGFRAMRSGADADICWRIQESFPHSMAVDRRILMEWEPRTSLRDLASQSYRYGKSSAYLQWVFDESKVPRGNSNSPTIRERLTPRDGQSIRDVLLEGAASLAFQAAFEVGFRQAKREKDDFEMPRLYESPVPDTGVVTAGQKTDGDTQPSSPPA